MPALALVIAPVPPDVPAAVAVPPASGALLAAADGGCIALARVPPVGAFGAWFAALTMGTEASLRAGLG